MVCSEKKVDGCFSWFVESRIERVVDREKEVVETRYRDLKNGGRGAFYNKGRVDALGRHGDLYQGIGSLPWPYDGVLANDINSI